MSIITLNHDAQSFFPSRRNTLPFATTHICPPQNPSPFPISYYNDPFYQYFSYQCYSFPLYATFQLVSPPCTPTLPLYVPRCSIEQLDESPGSEKSSACEEMVVPKPMACTSVVKCRRTRALRCQEPRGKYSVKVSHSMYEIREDVDLLMEGKTTLMIKNIPGKFSKGRFIAVLRDHCIAENRKALASEGEEAVLSEFDYFYLPIDFRTNSNFGYAFVNFTSPIGAWRLYQYLHNHHWISSGSNKNLGLCVSPGIRNWGNWCKLSICRGLAESIEHSDQMIFHPSVPDKYLPVHFEPPYNGLNVSIEYMHGRRV